MQPMLQYMKLSLGKIIPILRDFILRLQIKGEKNERCSIRNYRSSRKL